MLKLAYISQQELHCQVVNLSAMAEQICSELAKTEPDRVLHFDIAPGLYATGDFHLLQVALENLLGNACKYTRGKGEAHISLSSKQQDGRLIFAVADNGIGFDMTEKGKIFRSFQRLSNARKFPGFGIGLTTAQRIIHRHGGEIWAEAVPGEGATFYFTVS
jgi:signal transduction histidine kinase